MSCNRKPALPPVSTTPSTSSSHDSSSASPDLRRAVTVEGDRAVFSKILQIATWAVCFLWMVEGVTSVDDLTCLYTTLVSFAIEHDWGRIHRSAVQNSHHDLHPRRYIAFCFMHRSHWHWKMVTIELFTHVKLSPVNYLRLCCWWDSCLFPLLITLQS